MGVDLSAVRHSVRLTFLVPPRVSKFQISVLNFMHAFAVGSYVVPLAIVLTHHGYGSISVFPFCIAAVASLISPMIFGSLADKRFPPERMLGVVVAGGAVLLTIVYAAIAHRVSPLAYLALAACYHFWAAPGWGLLTSIGLMHLENPEREFAPLRVWATIGFMAGGASVALYDGDHSVATGYVGAGVFALEALFCFSLPPSHPPDAARPKRLREYLGIDALKLLRERDHRMVFVVNALYCVPLALFYPLVPRQLEELGVSSASLVMSLAQVSEVISMLVLGFMMSRYRFKWLLFVGILVGLLRFAAYMTNWLPLVVLGIFGHGLGFTLFFMTSQLYLEKRVSPAIRNQAQALLLLVQNGIGSLAGYLLGHWWLHSPWIAEKSNATRWFYFWLPFTVSILAVIIYFSLGYRGQGKAGDAALDGQPADPKSPSSSG